jgi:TRAP transporter TAXI family solute receptor
MRHFFIGTIALLSAVLTQPVFAQVKQDPSETPAEASLKEKKNAWTLGISGGMLDTTNMRFADEMGKVLNDGDELRILPIIGFGATSNLEDLLYLRGVDAAFTQSDVFEYFAKEKGIGNLANRVEYVARFPMAELHFIAPAKYKTLEDLRGKRVSFGPQGTAASLTANIVLERLGIQVDQVYQDHRTGMADLKSGKLDALIRCAGKPLGFVRDIPADSGLHLIPVPFNEKLADYYTLSELTSEHYPNIIPAGQTVDTIGVPTVLAVYNWPKNTYRYKRVERFVQRMFQNWDKFHDPAFHPSWKDVNLAATVPGWQRFDVAERMLKQTSLQGDRKQALGADFQKFLDNSGGAVAPKTQAERDALFRDFMAWHAQQSKKVQSRSN